MATHTLTLDLQLTDDVTLQDLKDLAKTMGISLDSLVSRCVDLGAKQLITHLADPQTEAMLAAHRDAGMIHLDPNSPNLSRHQTES